jgi:hypothetical protein
MADTSKKRRKTAKTQRRDARGTPKGAGAGSIAVGVAAGLGAIAAIVFGFRAATRRGGGAEHAAPDLAADRTVGSERAPDAFRPDPTAPVPASEREALRPATGPGPSLVATRGEMANQTGAANG